VDQHWLEDVLILLEEGSLAAAAERRHITQPAFSRRIKAFEQWLGKPVLERGANRIRIAPALRHNEPELRALRSRIEDLRARLRHHDPATTTVTLAAQHSTVTTTFAEMSLLARRDMPNVRFRLHAANQSDCLSMFVRRDADILMFYESPEDKPFSFEDSVTRTAIKTDQLALVANPALASNTDETGMLATDNPAIVFPTASYFGGLLSRFNKPFSTRELSANPVIDSAFTMGIKDCVLQGVGLAWLPLSLTHREIESGELIDLSDRHSRIDLEVVLYWRAPDPSVESLMRLWSNSSIS